jgi:hypothetical protein
MRVACDADGEVASYVGGDSFFDIYIDFASTDPDNYVLGTGDPIADPDQAGVPTLPTGTISLCAGELDPNNSAASAIANLATLQLQAVGGAVSTDVTISADTLRAGVIDEAGNAMNVTYPGPVTVLFADCPCEGNTNPGTDSVVNSTDISNIVGLLGPLAPPTNLPAYTVAKGAAGWDPCYDVNDDDVINSTDISKVVGLLGPLAPPTNLPAYTYTCPTPDPIP